MLWGKDVVGESLQHLRKGKEMTETQFNIRDIFEEQEGQSVSVTLTQAVEKLRLMETAEAISALHDIKADHDAHEQRIKELQEAREAERDQWTREREQYVARHANQLRIVEERADRYEQRLVEIQNTDQAQAREEVRRANQRAELAETRAEAAERRANLAEVDKRRALASVEDGGEIHPDDPRVQHIWRRAHRTAQALGFCTEYERIADELGIPQLPIPYSGTVTVSVDIPISGEATRQEINDGEMVDDLGMGDLIEAMNEHQGMMNYTIDSIDVTAEDE